MAAWAQPVSGGAELRTVELATGRAQTVDSGMISSPVFAGPYLVWGKVDRIGAYSFQAVDASTLRPAPLPDRLRHPGSIGYLAGSPEYLAWSDQTHTALTVWRLKSQDYRELRTPDHLHEFQFLQLAGHFLRSEEHTSELH